MYDEVVYPFVAASAAPCACLLSKASKVLHEQTPESHGSYAG